MKTITSQNSNVALIITFTIIIILSLLLSSVMNSFSQTGIGAGTKGLTFKYNTISRIGIELSLNPFAKNTELNFNGTRTELNTQIKFVDQFNFKLAAGFGISTVLNVASKVNQEIAQTTNNNKLIYNVPISIELMPFVNHRNIALCIESGMNFIKDGAMCMVPYGAAGITFYFGKRANKYNGITMGDLDGDEGADMYEIEK